MTANAPEGYSTVQPWLVSRDTGRLLDFISAAFDGHEPRTVASGTPRFESVTRYCSPSTPSPTGRDTPSMLRIFVDDVDVTFDRAVAAGARVVTPLDDAAWGDRGGRVRDPMGNIWWVVQHVEDVTADEIAVRMQDPKSLFARTPTP